MADWIYIILLIFIGLILVIVEMLFIPGTTIFGVLGAILTCVGIYFTYEYYGNTKGNYALFGSALVGLGLFVYSLKAKTWKRFALNGQIKSKVREDYTSDLNIGMVGVTLSNLRPIGKGEFHGKTYEVASEGEMIDADAEIEIIRINRNKIIVRLKE